METAPQRIWRIRHQHGRTDGCKAETPLAADFSREMACQRKARRRRNTPDKVRYTVLPLILYLPRLLSFSCSLTGPRIPPHTPQCLHLQVRLALPHGSLLPTLK